MKNYEVHWECSQLKINNVHGVYPTLAEATQSIYAWWEMLDYTPPYVRQWTKDRVTTIDYGLHYAYYRVYEIGTQEEQNLEQQNLEQPIINFTVDVSGRVPTRGRENDIAHDIYTSEPVFVIPGALQATIVSTGLRTAFDPLKYGLHISPRSSITKYPLTLANNTGIIEGEYRGEIGIPLKNTYALAGLITSSSYILTIESNGELGSISAESLFGNQHICDLYWKALQKWSEQQALIYGEDNIDFFESELYASKVVAGTMFIPKGVRLMQAYVVPRYDTLFDEVDALEETERGANGYGSSGVN